MNDNPEFQNAERAPYELLQLVAKLGVTEVGVPLSDEQRHLAEAIETHAHNATDVILSGIEAIGMALACAAVNPNWQLSSTNVNNLGMLIAHLAVEAQALHDTTSDIRYDLAQAKEATAKPARGARA